jgi:hypothetical protein
MQGSKAAAKRLNLHVQEQTVWKQGRALEAWNEGDTTIAMSVQVGRLAVWPTAARAKFGPDKEDQHDE